MWDDIVAKFFAATDAFIWFTASAAAMAESRNVRTCEDVVAFLPCFRERRRAVLAAARTRVQRSIPVLTISTRVSYEAEAMNPSRLTTRRNSGAPDSVKKTPPKY